MAMLTLNGTVQNVYEQPESKDKETGEVRPASLRAQILCENTTQSGEKKPAMKRLMELMSPISAVDPVLSNTHMPIAMLYRTSPSFENRFPCHRSRKFLLKY